MTLQRTIDSVEALYQKLERTFDRRPDYGDNQVDWVFDFAVTAWHLVDWVANKVGVPLKTTQDGFKTKCPELAVCEQICNGAKHLVLDNPNLQPFNVAVDVRCTDDLQGILRDVSPDKSNDVVLTPVVLITNKNGKPCDAIGVFHKVLRFWETELKLLSLM